MPDRPFQLFEISWEVCNKVGGIHTVLSSKAVTAVEAFGDDYVVVGPQLLGGTGVQPPFDEEPGHEDFVQSCRQLGVPVRIGRWRIPGRPRCILVGFSGLYEQKNGILSGLWERHKVDSIAGDWDYVEPVLFSIAAGMVIERWWEEYLAPFHRRAVVQAHEWMTGAALLYLQERIPSIGTVFTTHATMLGRALASLGITPDPTAGDKGLGGKTVEELARQHGVQAKHSLEGVCARKADVFTTVSSITAAEAELLHQRKAEPLLPNGIDLSVVDQLAAGDRKATRRELERVAKALLGEEVGDAAFVALAGRYEFHNKGIELLLDAVGELQQHKGKRVVVWLLVPSGNSGLRGELRDRLSGNGISSAIGTGPLGLCTHNLFDEARDPVHVHCKRLGLDNRLGSRVKVVQVPIYLRPDDGLFGREYEAVLAAMDLGAYPSYYEPWGYTPQEALAVGIPTVTTDLAGFGRWAVSAGLGPADGITVLKRERVPYKEVTAATVAALEAWLDRAHGDEALRTRCRAAAGRTSWRDLFANYRTGYAQALAAVQKRSTAGVVQFRLPRRALPSPGSGTTPRLSAFEASATLPQSLRGLDRLARNFWWVWNSGVRGLFEELAPGFRKSHENPVAFLQGVGLEALESKAKDADYLRRLQGVLKRFDEYMASGNQPLPLGANGQGPLLTAQHPIAYFSAEFGVHHSLPIYSGGLGILAGDHLKSASDLGVPLVGLGLFYRFGYMGQQLSSDGQQLAADRENRPRQLALEVVRAADGRPLEVTLPLPGRELTLRAWKAMVGRVPLYLLDANCPQNRPEDRDLTRNLYGGDAEVRIQQEIVLGRGGVRLLRALDLRPSVYHMNEGHAAFLTLERVSRLVRGEGLPFEAAREYVAATTLFTTHTPVPAGHDRFPEDMVRRYFGDAEEWVGLPWDRFFALGQAGSGTQEFNMTYLAMHFAGFVNGVSKLHGIASQKLLHAFWPGLLQQEVPVASITNGVHLATWTQPGIARLLRGDDQAPRPADFARAEQIAPADLWRVHQANKGLMLETVRQVLTRTFHARGDSPVVLSAMLAGLDDKALYLGFARRFAPYKRAHLMFTDPERLRRILSHPDHPVRVLVSGKAHPRDKLGQDILKSIVQIARSPEFIGRVLFVEDYDIAVARALVQGVDVWVNTPTRMEEASGTSGMKAAANGVLNLSIADGWWPEAADGGNGWTIGGSQVYGSHELQNQADATALYRLLEEELVPSFFARDGHGVPAAWVQMMSHCLATVPTLFNTDRMVSDYLDKAYRPLAAHYFAQQGQKKAPAREAAKEFLRIKAGFEKVRIVAATTVELAEFRVGQHLDVHLEVDLGALQPKDVVVELVVCRGEFDQGQELAVVPLAATGAPKGSVHTFDGGYRIEQAGQYQHGLRVRVPGHGGHDAKVRGLVLWA
ncbi:MAG: alpha-glucan family phosphorylase [Planctomycetes bacterium]|nr:alpha-glucan family phosphorylase [Planctomycetota bacterium]